MRRCLWSAGRFGRWLLPCRSGDGLPSAGSCSAGSSVSERAACVGDDPPAGLKDCDAATCEPQGDAVRLQASTHSWNCSSSDEEEHCSFPDGSFALRAPETFRPDVEGEAEAVARLRQLARLELDGERASPALLLRCLQARDFDEAGALRLLQNFVRLRRGAGWPLTFCLTGSCYGGRLLRALLSGVSWVLPAADVEGRVVVVSRPALMDTSSGLTVADFQQMCCFVMQWATGLIPRGCTEERHVAGNMHMTLVIDFTGIGLSFLARWGSQEMARGFFVGQDSFPLKLRAIYVLDPGRLVSGLVSLVRGCLSPKLRKRVVTFNPRAATGVGSMEDLRRRLSGSLADIPTNWGGGLDYAASDSCSELPARNAAGWAAAVHAELERAKEACARARASQAPAAAYEWWENWVEVEEAAELAGDYCSTTFPSKGV